MEGFYWVRALAILSMLGGSVYVLLPSVLQTDHESERHNKILDVDTSVAGPNFDVQFTAEGDAEEARAALELRLRAREIPIDGVVLSEAGEVVVRLAPGGSRAEVLRVVQQPIVSFQSSGLGALSGEGPLSAPDALAAAVGQAKQISVCDAWEPSCKTLSVGSLEQLESDPRLEGGRIGADRLYAFEAEGQELPEAMALAVGSQLVAVAVVLDEAPTEDPVEEAPEDLPPVLLIRSLSADLASFLSTPPKLTVLPEPETEGPATAAATESSLPPWLLSVLPDTKMNLGLDLRGGIDLTLQVELEQAVLSQVSRDSAYLRDRAAEEGIELIDVKRDRREPVMLLTTDAAVGDLTKFFSKRMGDYQYDGSDGNTHRFKIRDERAKVIGDEAVEQVLETLRKRVDETGVKEPSIVKKGGGRINVQLPGEVDLGSAIEAIGTTAMLEFRLHDYKFPESDIRRMLAAAEDALPPAQYADDMTINNWLWDQGRLPEDRIFLWKYEETREEDGSITKKRDFAMALKSEIVLTGNDVNRASVSWDNANQPYVRLEFKPGGSRAFCSITTANLNRQFAIVLDGQIRSAPVIRDRICGGVASIEMGGALDPIGDANTLSLVLRTGSLNAPVNVGEVRLIGAQLGADSIRAGGWATLIGASLVISFMLLWYRKAGMVANIALGLNVLMVLAILSLFGATLTLPGIAGIALTVGMAVDANIIVFERIREELRTGQNARKAVDAGFEKAVVAVLDANITTGIAGVVLYSYGTGPIKGFAVTLMIGIVTTLVTALFVTRTLMVLVTRRATARLRI